MGNTRIGARHLRRAAGVPKSYLAAADRVQSWRSPTTFIELVSATCSNPDFFVASSDSDDWQIERPFFSVPSGVGGLNGYVAAAARMGVTLYRTFDKATKAKPVFVKSGIPGSVGCAACSLWQELGQHLEQKRAFRVWPFEGDLREILRSTSVVIGEIYPRAAYASALLDSPAPVRPPLAVAKTDPTVRQKAISLLVSTEWVRNLGVAIEDIQPAESNEDDFDACMTAAALLRCVLERDDLCPPARIDARAEGGILGTSGINLELTERPFSARAGKRKLPLSESINTSRSPIREAMRTSRCPIEGCGKIYQGTRGGWDGHVGSARNHPSWHPELITVEARKRQFEREFPEFFCLSQSVRDCDEQPAMVRRPGAACGTGKIKRPAGR